MWCPLGDFFGTAPGVNLYKSLPLGMTDRRGLLLLVYAVREERAGRADQRGEHALPDRVRQ